MNNLKLTNTFFKQKPAHSSTWKCPERTNEVIDSRTKTARKNPYRNQIDYILTRNSNNNHVLNSRSYGGFQCISDHKPVICKINIKWKYKNKTKQQVKKLNCNGINLSKETKAKYQDIVKQQIRSTIADTAQEKWDRVIQATRNATYQVAGYKEKRKNGNNAEVEILSSQQKELHEKIKSEALNDNIKKLKNQRNKILHKIHKILTKQENQLKENVMKPIENMPDEPRKTFAALKHMKRMKLAEPLLIRSENGLTTNQQTQSNLIADYFKDTFFKNADTLPTLKPEGMILPFTADEVRNAAGSLKNNTSPGIDQVTSEMIKYGPTELFQEIADILNIVALTGESPKELSIGIITPLQKSGKKKGPISNLRPIALLSIIRKLIAICLCKRTDQRIDKEIPANQAAYRSGRSTIEHVFAVNKMVVERVIASKNEEIHLLLPIRYVKSI